MFEAKYILPLLAVTFGWALNEASGFLRTAREEKQYISSTISVLLRLCVEQYRINKILTILNTDLGSELETIYN
jgi:hypothetical protein